MKTPVAVTLVLVGGFLILGPALIDHLARAQVAAAMVELKATPLSLNPPPMSSAYRFGCWVMGSLMIASAISSSWRKRERAVEEAVDFAAASPTQTSK